MEEQDWKWMNERFNRVDADNKHIKDELVTVHEKVNRHDVYWSITKRATGGMTVGGLLTYLGSFLGIDPFHLRK